MRKDRMRNATRTTNKVCFFLFVVAPALAQNFDSRGASPAATGPAYDLSIGYSNLSMAIPAARHASLSGLDLSGDVTVSPRWGATLDTNYVRTSNILGTPRAGYALISQAGPVFSPVEHRNTRVFVRVLAGMGLVDGAMPISKTAYFHGWSARPSYALGGGVEQSISGPFALRVSGDYLRTSFFDTAGGLRPQSNVRATVSLVFRLNQRQPKAIGH
jgi:hypothetical protein